MKAIKQISDWLRDVQGFVVTLGGLTLFISSIAVFYKENVEVALKDIGLWSNATALILFFLSIIFWVVGLFISDKGRILRKRLRKRKETLDKMQKDLGWIKGYFPFSQVLFKIKPKEPNADWLEYNLELALYPRCPKCRMELKKETDKKLVCTESQCGTEIQEERDIYQIGQAALNSFRITIEDWQEQNPNCGKINVEGTLHPELLEVPNEYDSDMLSRRR